MENYVELIEVLTSIDKHLSSISMHLSWIPLLMLFLLLKTMNSNDGLDKIYQPIRAIEDGMIAIIDQLKKIGKNNYD